MLKTLTRTASFIYLAGLAYASSGGGVMINEVDADTPGTDALEFIELYDGGVGNTDLTGLVVVLINGSDDLSYNDAYDLDGLFTDANGYFVIGSPTLVPAADIVFTPGATNQVQNGADAVALYFGDAVDWPNDTAFTTTNLIDAVVYDTNDSDDAGLLVLDINGYGQLNEDENGDKDNHSNQRCTPGVNTWDAAPATPGAANDCNPIIDADMDGFDSTVDCDDTDPNVFPGAVEICGNGIDDNCDTQIDETCVDLDMDGFDTSVDCDDSDPAINPAAVEICENGVDENCDGVDDVCPADLDMDGFDSPEDCDDTDPLINPAATEICGNGIDEDCDGMDGFCPSVVSFNEVDADSAGSDVLEFIELYDGGVGNTDLSGLVIVFFNGSTGLSYDVSSFPTDAFDLDGFSTDANGYFLLGNADVVPTPSIIFAGNGLQNGADAVALFGADDVDFPEGTSVADALANFPLVDAVVYDTNDSDDPDVLPLDINNYGQLNEGGNFNSAFHSNQRCSGADWTAASATPGAPNDCSPDSDDCANPEVAFFGAGAGTLGYDTTYATDSGVDPGCGFGPMNDVWIQWMPDSHGEWTFSTCDTASYDTRLALYDSCGGVSILCNDDGGGCTGFTSILTVPCLSPATTYYVQVGGWNGSAGTGSLDISQTGTDLTNCPQGTLNYCNTAPNTAGAGAIMGSSGSTSIMADDLVIEATGLPDDFCIFFWGVAKDNFVPAGFNGSQCVANPVRLPAIILASGNSASRAVTQAEIGSPAAGDTRYFQCFYRDFGNLGNGANTSDGLAVTFGL